MLFNSDVFLFGFLPATLLGFWALGRWQPRLVVVWLVAASLFFYAWWNPVHLPLLLASLVGNYLLGARIAGAAGTAWRRVWLALGVAANLALLGYFKYAGFLTENVGAVAGTSWRLEAIVLPLAISFYTFQQISFLVDAARGRTRGLDFLRYALFVTFFPQLIAGPIVYHSEMTPQFADRRFGRVRAADLAVGLTILAIGLCKKVAIADTVAPYADGVFDAAKSGAEIGLLAAWQGTLAYAAQIYFDFSGYSDMAIGLARMFGLRLPLNFNSPYKAASIVEFWRRWHMTLSRFLRDYLYFPLGGNRHGPRRRHVNLMAVMLLGGLWHGAAWTFVIWGGLHGLYLLVNHAWRRLTAGRAASAAERVLGRALTLVAVLAAWVFFRAEGLDAALAVEAGLFGLNGLGASLHSAEGLAVSVAVMGFALLAPNTYEFMRLARPALVGAGERAAARRVRLVWVPNRAFAVATASLAAVAVLSLWQLSPFLYFQF